MTDSLSGGRAGKSVTVSERESGALQAGGTDISASSHGLLEELTDELRGLRALETELRHDLNTLKIQ